MHVHPLQLHTPTIIHVPSSEIKPSATPTAAMAHIPTSYPSVITQHITQPSAVASVPSVVTSIQNVMATPQDQLAANAALLTQQLAAAGMLSIKAERFDPTKMYVSEYGKVTGVLNPALYASPALYTQVVPSSGQYPVKSEVTVENTAPAKLYTSGQLENTATSQAAAMATSQAAMFAQQVANTAATGVATKVTTTEPQIQTTNVGLSAALLMQQLAAGVLGYQLRGDFNQQQLALAGFTGRPEPVATAASHPSPLGLYSNQVSTITANPTMLPQQIVSETSSKTVATPTGGILPSLFARPPGTFGLLSVASTPSQPLQSTSLVANPAQMLYNFANSATVPQFKTVDTAISSQSQAIHPATTQAVLAQPADNLGLYR
ncbi:uncharacterized protein [Amphiura filiformis]|uniref:uncharacterized protein n=1 Tax=Amphiura filiformis TaxID=82378 RepID=UPI003B22848F